MLLRALLVVDDEDLGRRVRSALRGADVLVSETAPTDKPTDKPTGKPTDKLWGLLGDQSFDLLLATPSALPDPILDAVGRIRAFPDRPEVVLLGDLGLEERARLLSAGALAVVARALADDVLRTTLHALASRSREARSASGPRPPVSGAKLSDLSSKSPSMQAALALSKKVARADASLLLLGETGSGKEWLARAIHREGPRAQEAFVAVNPSALPEPLLESELFGHEKGAFTGASKARRGAFEVAHNGTLFLDEIGDMPVHLQIKLLRTLQEREIQRLGSERPVPINVRVIAATNQDLDQLLRDKKFREDLYYRLSVVRVAIPPLRERIEDLRDLIALTIGRFSEQLGRKVEGATEDALVALEAYSWPGNVRELINVAERAVLLCEGEQITLAELPEELSEIALRPEEVESWQPALFDLPLAEARNELTGRFERAYLERLLVRFGGNIGRTASHAGIDPRTLYNKLRRYGWTKEDFKDRETRSSPRSLRQEARDGGEDGGQ